MQSYKFEHEKEIAKEIVRNKLVEFEYTITSEKSINNDFGYKFCGDKFAVIIYFKNDKSSRLVFEKASEEIVSLFQQCFDDEKSDKEIKEKTVPIHTSIKIADKSKIEDLKSLLLTSFTNTSIVENQTPIVSETTSFMMKFLTISSRDSKDAITLFSSIMNDIYTTNKVSKDLIINTIAAELVKQGVTADKLKSDLASLDAYEQNKKLTISLLALYDSTSKDEFGKTKISYDQAYTLLNSFSSALSLDHLLVQTPERDSNEFKYYRDESDSLVLKDGHDFPSEIITGMDYDTFTRKILNQIGNLRIYYKDKNSGRQNTAIDLPEYDDFNTYNDIVERGKNLINTIVDDCLPTPDIDISQIKTNNKKLEASLPKMDKLIEFGLIKKGDKIYLTLKPDESVATLIDEKYVDFNGEKITLNEWGCRVTGWQSIRIYAYVAKVGEIETLHQKRLAFIQEHNEPVC